MIGAPASKISVIMANYKIKLVSQTNATVLVVLSLAAFMIGVGLCIPHGLHNTGLAVLVAIASLAIVYFLWQLFVIGRTEWTISDDGISILWTRKFPLAEPRLGSGLLGQMCHIRTVSGNQTLADQQTPWPEARRASHHRRTADDLAYKSG